MLNNSTPYLLLLVCTLLVFTTPGCEQIEPPDTSEFTLQDEVKLGQELQEAVTRNSAEYPLLDENNYANLYAYANGLLDELIQTGNIEHINNGFDWSVKIIQDDASESAFTLPGGPIYMSSGLLKYLVSEHEFLALLAHEMAYADRSLVKNFLADEFGLTVLLDVSLGSNPEIADTLLDLIANSTYPKAITKQADEYSVALVCHTDYLPDGLLDILERAQSMPSLNLDWLNKRPGDNDRQVNIEDLISDLNCSGVNEGTNNYAEFLSLLP
ncbi:MAG: M48 family metalloprotease [Bacteroidota bacterium]